MIDPPALRVLLGLLPAVVACSSEHVAPLVDFGPIDASMIVELGPLAADPGREDVNPRVHVSLHHTNSACPVLGDSVEATLDGKPPDAFERGYYEEGGGYGHDDDPICQSPYFSFDRAPDPRDRSVLRVADDTATLELEGDRLFVNPEMALASPLARGQQAQIAVADDRTITKASAMWWIGDETAATGYDLAPTIVDGGLVVDVPAEIESGTGWIEVRVELAEPALACRGFAACHVSLHGSARFTAAIP